MPSPLNVSREQLGKVLQRAEAASALQHHIDSISWLRTTRYGDSPGEQYWGDCIDLFDDLSSWLAEQQPAAPAVEKLRSELQLFGGIVDYVQRPSSGVEADASGAGGGSASLRPEDTLQLRDFSQLSQPQAEPLVEKLRLALRGMRGRWCSLMEVLAALELWLAVAE